MSGVSRLTLAIGADDPALPDTGDIAVFAPRAGFDLSALPLDRCVVVTGFKPDHDHFERQGFRCQPDLEDGQRFAASLVCIPRAKALAQLLIGRATDRTDGVVMVDGIKTDGIEPILKSCRKRVAVGTVLSKAHGKLFHFPGGTGFNDWAQTEPVTVEGGFATAPGVFSADGIDPASDLLTSLLPKSLGKQVADLGAGWGFLSARALERDDIESIHLVEADHTALACARKNVNDQRAQFHWADVPNWQAPALMDSIITNPPFHTGRKAEPGLGVAFIQAAARLLAPRGQLFLVANRHLPYESELERHFAEVSEIGGDNRFKLLRAARLRKKQGR